MAHRVETRGVDRGNSVDAKLKTCARCGQEKQTDSFSKDSNEPDGLKRYCKECVRAQTASYRSRNRDEINRRKREAWSKTKETESTAKALESGSKVCSSCGKEKPVEEFYRRGNGNFYSRCKACEQAAQKHFRETNGDHISTQRKEYNRRHRAQIRSYNHAYAAEHSAEAVARAKKWAAENPERAREARRNATQRRTAKKNGLPHTLTQEEWEECKEYFGNSCAYCGCTQDTLAQEHVVPVSKGGAYTKGNIIPACTSCNSRKSSSDVWEWFRAQRFYSSEREQQIRNYLSMF